MFKNKNLLYVLLCGLMGSIELLASATEIKANEQNFQSVPENIVTLANDKNCPGHQKLAQQQYMPLRWQDASPQAVSHTV